MTESEYTMELIARDTLLEILSARDTVTIDGQTYKRISDEITGHSRWSVDYYLTFQMGDRFFGTSYSRGATEYQDESPWEYEADHVPCTELEAVRITRTEYQPKK